MKNKIILLTFLILAISATGVHFYSNRSPKETEEVYKTLLHTSITDNREFPNFCLKAALNEDVFEQFRKEGQCVLFLDNVSKNQGKDYLNTIIAEYPNLYYLLDSFRKNDELGSPNTYSYKTIDSVSPKTLQHVKIAGDIQTLFGDLNGKTIIEIGGGYGGQCAILSRLFDFKEYIIVDLPEALQLSKRYLQALNISNVIFKTPEEIETTQPDLVFSNFAFSQCTKKMQTEYIDNIFKKAMAGYILCDEISALYGVDSYSPQEVTTLLSPLSPETLIDHPSNSSIIYWH